MHHSHPCTGRVQEPYSLLTLALVEFMNNTHYSPLFSLLTPVLERVNNHSHPSLVETVIHSHPGTHRRHFLSLEKYGQCFTN